MCVSPVLVDEVDAERVGGQLHQPIHGHVDVAAPRRLPGPQGQAVVHQAAGVPAAHTQSCNLCVCPAPGSVSKGHAPLVLFTVNETRVWEALGDEQLQPSSV